MRSRFLRLLLALVCPFCAVQARVLRVCADPNNLPFSNQRGEGFENHLAELIARDLGDRLEYTWWSQRKNFLRNSLGKGLCDVVMGVPAALDSVTVTHPYYRSSYVFVTRKDRDLRLVSLNDTRLSGWRIGIHVVGDDYAPPGAALARRGLAANIVGFSLFGSFAEENAAGRLVHAVASGDVDVAIVWGPQAGFFARRETTPLEIAPVSPSAFLSIPFTYDVSMAVRKGDESLKRILEGSLQRNCAAVCSILSHYGVPQLAAGEQKWTCGSSPLPVSSSR